MSKLTRNQLILAKLQPGAGVDAAPTAALNAILCRNITPAPLTAEWADRNLIKPYFGSSGKVLTGAYSRISFEVELAGAGAAGDAPKWGTLLRGCAFAEEITEDVEVIYTTITNGQEFLTLWYYLDGIRHQMTDAKGNVTFTLNAKNIPVMQFEFIGLQVPPADVVQPTDADFSGFIDPIAVNKQNTAAWSLHGYTGPMESLSINMNNQLVYRNVVGEEGIHITNRLATGSISMSAVALATKNWFSTIKAATKGALSITHGTVAGNIVKLDAPKVQLTEPSQGDSDGIALLNANLEVEPNAGNDELVITVK